MNAILKFCQGLPEKTFQPGDIVTAERTREGILYILIEGAIEVLKDDFQVHTTSEPGSVFGEMSVLLDSPYTATVKATAPTRMYRVEQAEAFLQSHTDVMYEVAKLLALRLWNASDYLADLQHQYKDQTDRLELIDEVLETLEHQLGDALNPGADRDPEPNS